MEGLGQREIWTAKCLLNGNEFSCGRINDIFQCRHPNRFSCPNFMRHYEKGCNCRLAVSPHPRYDRYCLPSRLQPEVERLRDRSTLGLAALYNQTEKAYFECKVPETKTQLRATLGAIIIILTERDAKTVIFENLEVHS